jgi:N-acetylglucosaminyl-diphospho-decaprenol L-rhamnosyltransferase
MRGGGRYGAPVRTSIDVVLVAYNRYELTESCLRHLRAQTVAHNLIVVDNGSTDETRVRVRAEWPAAQLVRFEENQSFPRACNRGVASGSGEIVVLVNNDVDCEADLLERLVAPFADPGVGSVAPLMLQPGGERIDSFGLAADATLACFPRLQGMPVTSVRGALPVLAGPSGTVAAYRRAAWEQAGGFDEAIFAYMEDFDLALRLRIAGWRAAAAADAVGVHLGSATRGHRSASQRRDGGFGRGYTLRRYRGRAGRVALRTWVTEAVVVLGDLAISRDAAALRGRLEGWHAGRKRGRLPAPPPDAIDRQIGFRDSLALRRGVYARRAA